MRHPLNFLFILLSAGAWTLANAWHWENNGPNCECAYSEGPNNLDFSPDIAREPPPKEKYFVKTLSERNVDMDSVASRSKQEILPYLNIYCCHLIAIYKKYINYLKTKYSQRLKSDFSGKITLKFTIAPSGKITNISIMSSTTDYPEFDNAVKNRVKNWIWKTIKSGETTPTIVTITFTFYIQE